MRIVLSGLAGAGKTTLCTMISQYLKEVSTEKYITLFSGKIFRENARKKNMNIMDYSSWCQNRTEQDVLIEIKMFNLLKRLGHAVIESRVLPSLIEYSSLSNIISIYVKTSTENCIQRISDRESISIESAEKEFQYRTSQDRERYESIYGVNCFKPSSANYNYKVLNNSTIDVCFIEIKKILNKYLLKKLI